MDDMVDYLIDSSLTSYHDYYLLYHDSSNLSLSHFFRFSYLSSSSHSRLCGQATQAGYMRETTMHDDYGDPLETTNVPWISTVSGSYRAFYPPTTIESVWMLCSASM